MNIRSEQLFTNVVPKSALGRIIQFPLIRLLIVFLFFVPVALLHNATVDHLIAKFSQPYFSYLLSIESIANFALFLLAYRLYTRYVERRKAYEMSGKNSLGEFGLGFFISLGLVGFMVLLMSSLGYYRIDSLNPWHVILTSFFRFGIGAFLQELAFRMVIFKLTEEFLGSWIAIFINAVLFSFIHMGNENATIWTTLALVIGSGIIDPAAYMYTRRVWFVWGIHLGWNYFQDGIFGMPNSGITKLPSWINPSIDGPGWITGGSFGIEASYIAIFMSLAVGILILKKAIDRGQLVLPMWRRRRLQTEINQ